MFIGIVSLVANFALLVMLCYELKNQIQKLG